MSLLLLAGLPLAGCVTDSQRETVHISMPPVASTSADYANADPLGLQAAIARVRQPSWCYRRSGLRQ
ncbi:MAG TPA: hypothetical protein VJ890_21700 [Vineibacter sp.]|nr:hypothetical protein [Vineibacter sp.]